MEAKHDAPRRGSMNRPTSRCEAEYFGGFRLWRVERCWLVIGPDGHCAAGTFVDRDDAEREAVRLSLRAPMSEVAR